MAEAPRASATTLQWLGVVEQDVLPGLGAPKESARRNRLYLRGLGLYYDEIIGRPERSGPGRMPEVIGLTGAGSA